MKFFTAMEHLRQKFTSGNEIPVTQAVITQEEFEAIEEFLRNSSYETRSTDFDADETNVGC